VATNILMPALSPTMTEGTLSRWLKQEGEPIRAGDVIAEIETDKATMEVEAVDEGVLGKILVGDGTEHVPVNQPIGVLVEEGETVPAAAPSAPPAVPQKAAATPPIATASAPPTAPPSPSGNGQNVESRIFVSPLARRMALQAGIDLSGLKGSGPNGRIVKADIEAAQQRGGEAQPVPVSKSATARSPLPPVTIAAPHRVEPLSTMRKVIARRMAEAKQTIPHFYVTMDVALDRLLKLREELNTRSPDEGPNKFRLSVNDMLIKAAAVALRRVPQVNASYAGDNKVLYDDVDISVAVSIPDGLITPIVRKADQKGLVTISNEMKDLIARARANRLKPEEFQGGGFSISNLGMYGVSQFSAIINPPQAAILAVAAAEARPVVKNGSVAVATMMACTLAVDHRVLDGAIGAEWLREFKAIVEDPLGLML
jgi:pyruvate dehydrogenase E2 component (dihydrolipoamide acetyltransferase)